MNFFIIYIPNTVKILSPLIFSLLRNSTCTFCLVSNGCQEEEKQFLKNLCSKEKRLLFLNLPTNQMWQHGKALNYLYQFNQSDYFCFMDSDIFAMNPYLSQFEALIDDYTGVFSCSALWMPDRDKVMPETYPKISGRYHSTTKGVCTGSSYFAIYNCKKIRALYPRIKIDFNKFKWNDIPKSYQKILSNLGLEKSEYDTGKVFNIMLYHYGEQLYFTEADHLIHIGGISAKTARNGIFNNKKLAQVLYKFPENFLKEKLLQLATVSIRNIPTLLSARNRYNTKRIVRKAMVTKYFSELLDYLLFETKKPKMIKLKSKEIQDKVEIAAMKLSLFITNNEECMKVKLNFDYSILMK